jgi:hypothetical protein
VWGASLALVVAFSSGLALAAEGDKPDAKAADGGANGPNAVDMIFEHKHLSNVEQGKEIVYKFNRTVSQPEMLGQPFTDDITLKVTAEKEAGKKDVDLQIYTGERARDLQQLPNLTVNPVYQVYFRQAVSTFSMLSGGKANYLTRVFSLAFRDKAKVEPIKVDYQGKKIDAYRITMAPYLGDQNESKMQGWEGAEYVLVLSEQVPGEIIDLIAKYNNKYTPNMQLVERITLDGVTGLEDAK